MIEIAIRNKYDCTRSIKNIAPDLIVLINLSKRKEQFDSESILSVCQ